MSKSFINDYASSWTFFFSKNMYLYWPKINYNYFVEWSSGDFCSRNVGHKSYLFTEASFPFFLFLPVGDLKLKTATTFCKHVFLVKKRDILVQFWNKSVLESKYLCWYKKKIGSKDHHTSLSFVACSFFLNISVRKKNRMYDSKINDSIVYLRCFPGCDK